MWSSRVTFAHPKIGWVRGTGLMGGNDPLVEVVERHGLKTYSTAEIAVELLNLSTRESRIEAAKAPLDVDLTGGLGNEPIDIKALRAEAMEDAAQAEARMPRTQSQATNPIPRPRRSSSAAKPACSASGQGRSCRLAERQRTSGRRNRHRRPWVNLAHGAPAAPVSKPNSASIPTARWICLPARCSNWHGIWPADVERQPQPGWYDVDGNLVPEEDIAERYHDEVVARSGIRPFDEGMGNDYKDGTDEEEAEVFLDHDVTFSVPTREIAEEYVKLDEAHTSFAADAESGEWNVTRHAGSMIRVPRRAAMTRTVGGQFPKGFDPVKWGIPASMVGDVDKIALWNIVTTVDAYLSAGFTPTEILEAVHPSMVASTQGTGFGGMASMRKLYLDRFLNHEIPTDILQEALPNVVAAHVMQSYIGGYGNMVQPVSACARLPSPLKRVPTRSPSARPTSWSPVRSTTSAWNP